MGWRALRTKSCLPQGVTLGRLFRQAVYSWLHFLICLLFLDLVIAFCLLLLLLFSICLSWTHGPWRTCYLVILLKDLITFTEAGAKVLLVVRDGISDFCATEGSARRPGLSQEISPKQRITYVHTHMQIRVEAWIRTCSVGGSVLPTLVKSQEGTEW